MLIQILAFVVFLEILAVPVAGMIVLDSYYDD